MKIFSCKAPEHPADSLYVKISTFFQFNNSSSWQPGLKIKTAGF